MESYLKSLMIFLFFLFLFSMDYWGPGVRNILNAISVRIAKTPAGTAENEPLLSGKTKYIPWILALPAAIWFAIKIWEWTVVP